MPGGVSVPCVTRRPDRGNAFVTGLCSLCERVQLVNFGFFVTNIKILMPKKTPVA
jgi:hypothetical protein